MYTSGHRPSPPARTAKSEKKVKILLASFFASSPSAGGWAGGRGRAGSRMWAGACRLLCCSRAGDGCRGGLGLVEGCRAGAVGSCHDWHSRWGAKRTAVTVAVVAAPIQPRISPTARRQPAHHDSHPHWEQHSKSRQAPDRRGWTRAPTD